MKSTMYAGCIDWVYIKGLGSERDEQIIQTDMASDQGVSDHNAVIVTLSLCNDDKSQNFKFMTFNVEEYFHSFSDVDLGKCGVSDLRKKLQPTRYFEKLKPWVFGKIAKV